MTDKKLTDNEIVKALEFCLDTSPSTCKNCPLFNATNSTMVCSKIATKSALDLITRQQEEIERLKGWDNLLKAEKHSLIKSEAIKEFAERLKDKWFDESYYSPDVDFDDFIDNLVKEMAGE